MNSFAKENQDFDFRENIYNNIMLITLLILIIGIIIIEPSFISINSFKNILVQSATRIIIALGVGGIMITKGIDLSAGRMIGLSAVVSASLLQASDYAYCMYPDLLELPISIPILLSMVLCGMIGYINGVLISKLKIPTYIATMGTMLLVYGVTSLYFDRPPYGAQAIMGLKEKYKQLAVEGIILGEFKIPYIVIISVIVSAIMWFVWNKTKVGKNMFMIGTNLKNEDILDINITKNLIAIYVVAGFLYGLAGSLEVARVGSATNNTGFMYEIDAIVACIIGGVSLTGGVGSVGGIIISVLIFQILNYGLSFVGVSVYLQFIIKGIILIVAVVVDTNNTIRKNNKIA